MSACRPTVVLTDAILASAHERLAEHAQVVLAPDDQDAFYAAIADAEGLIVRRRLPDDIFERPNRLKGVVRHGVGLDMIPMASATAHRIPVANMPGSNHASVVEYCLNAMFQFFRPFDKLQVNRRGSDWAEIRPRSSHSMELAGQTLGIIGLGSIGGRLATIAHAMDMHVLTLARPGRSVPTGVRAVSKDDLLAHSDVVVLSCPLTPDTHHLMDATALSRMRPSALLINVARGPVIDRHALIEALSDRRLAGAVLDVHDVQPIAPGDYPDGTPGLVLTPHLAGTTRSSVSRMSEGSVDEILRVLQGQRFQNLVNPEIYD